MNRTQEQLQELLRQHATRIREVVQHPDPKTDWLVSLLGELASLVVDDGTNLNYEI